MKTTNLKKTYGGKTILELPPISFEKGKIYALMGGNGSGKSTFAKLLAGVIEADGKGCVHRETGETIRYMPQKSYTFRLRTRSNVLLGGADKQRSERLMGEVGLAELAEQSGHKLSVGESARMSLARILMSPCDVLIIDEPTAAMDMKATLAAETMVKKYRDEFGCAVIWISHSLAQAQRIADELIFLDGGRLIASGIPKDVLSEQNNPVLKAFLDFYCFS